MLLSFVAIIHSPECMAQCWVSYPGLLQAAQGIRLLPGPNTLLLKHETAAGPVLEGASHDTTALVSIQCNRGCVVTPPALQLPWCTDGQGAASSQATGAQVDIIKQAEALSEPASQDTAASADGSVATEERRAAVQDGVCSAAADLVTEGQTGEEEGSASAWHMQAVLAAWLAGVVLLWRVLVPLAC